MQNSSIKNTCLNIIFRHHFFCSLIFEMIASLKIDVKNWKYCYSKYQYIIHQKKCYYKYQ